MTVKILTSLAGDVISGFDGIPRLLPGIENDVCITVVVSCHRTIPDTDTLKSYRHPFVLSIVSLVTRIAPELLPGDMDIVYPLRQRIRRVVRRGLVTLVAVLVVMA